DEKFRALVDLTSWEKDSFSPIRYAVWLKVVSVFKPLEALRELRRMDKDELLLFISSVLSIDWYNPDDIYEGEATLSPDNSFILIPKDGNLESELSSLAVGIINAAYAGGIAFGRELCVDSMGMMYSATEEESFNNRNSRLADEGIPTYIEALELFHYEDPSSLLKRLVKMVGDEEYKKHSPSTGYLISGFTVLPRAFWEDRYELEKELVDDLKVELSALLTASIVVNNALDRDAEHIKGIIERSRSYFALGLELLIEEAPKAFTVDKMLRFIKLRHLFRLGFSLLIDLKKNAANVSSAVKDFAEPVAFTADEEEFLNNLLQPIPMFKPSLTDAALPFDDLSRLKDARKLLSILASKIVKK
ncbi:MAG: hypothetical protein JXA66_07115, partial [Oligoflexia bacterium]|nr:hypothetical protein [Oligoflexia bacterium]